MDILLNIEREKENFKDHVATFTDLGNIKILDFKKPGSSHYRIRFLFEEDYYRLHISGDLGELTATNFTNMCYEHFGDFVRDVGYFEQKIDCHSRSLYVYEPEKVTEDLNRILDEMEYEFVPESWDSRTPEELREEFIEKMQDEIYVKSGLTVEGYALLQEIDPDCFEYAENIGKVRTGVLELYMLAFELAQEQLSQNKGAEGEEK